MKLTLGFSTCPNDTFMFDALVNEKIDLKGYTFEVVMEDILHLNSRAISHEVDMVKISYNTYGLVRNEYELLEAGSALGKNCGPLLISKKELTIEEIIEQKLAVGIPGQHTTANLLLGYFAPDLENKQVYLFHEIMPALLNEEIDAGVIIHENRFTYPSHGLKLVQDLGEHWEGQTHFPIPLGAIVTQKKLGQKVISDLNGLMQASVEYAFQHPESSIDFVRSYAQEMDESVMKSHIDLYVNNYSLSLGREGHQAIDKLLSIGAEMGLYA